MWGGLLSGGEVLFPSSFLQTKEGFEVSSSNLIKVTYKYKFKQEISSCTKNEINYRF